MGKASAFKIPVIPKMKACRKCGTSKVAAQFNPSPTGKDGLKNICRPCESAWAKERRAAKLAEQKGETT
jgi:hypothetical protein